MNIPVTSTTTDIPPCFSKEWDPNSTECAGGPDPNFVNRTQGSPHQGTHIHDRCDFFISCGTRTQALRQAQAQRIIPPEHLIRPQPPGQWRAPGAPTPPPMPATVGGQPRSFADFLREQHASHVEAQRQAAMVGNRPPVQPPMQQPQWMPQQGPYVHAQHGYPAPAYQLNYMMPGYLSVPEERMPGEGLGPVLFREVFRSVFKAGGHAVAHFFDMRPIKVK